MVLRLFLLICLLRLGFRRLLHIIRGGLCAFLRLGSLLVWLLLAAGWPTAMLLVWVHGLALSSRRLLLPLSLALLCLIAWLPCLAFAAALLHRGIVGCSWRC